MPLTALIFLIGLGVFLLVDIIFAGVEFGSLASNSDSNTNMQTFAGVGSIIFSNFDLDLDCL
jgi:hypothetical protein